MIIFIKILLAHILGDFLLQPTSWVAEKEKRKAASPKLYYHVLIHGILVMLVLWDLEFWTLAITVTVTHFLIDWAKLAFQKKKTMTVWFIVDQILHVAVLIVVTIVWIQPDSSWQSVFQSIPILTVITAVCFLSFASALIMNVMLEPWSIKTTDGEQNSLANAGKYIGILERLFVFVFILTNHWEGVGFLIAAKSVFRFGDLKKSKDRKLTEYILIGTLLSFGLAIIIALATIYLIKSY